MKELVSSLTVYDTPNPENKKNIHLNFSIIENDPHLILKKMIIFTSTVLAASFKTDKKELLKKYNLNNYEN